MLFWTTHFSVLDSTFFVLDSTFWLDSTLKIDPVLVCPSVCPSVRKVTHERMVGRRSNFVDQIWSACARDDHLQVIEFGMIWFSTWIQDHFSTFLNITIYGCYCVHKTKYTLVNCFRGKRRSVSALCPPPLSDTVYYWLLSSRNCYCCACGFFHYLRTYDRTDESGSI